MGFKFSCWLCDIGYLIWCLPYARHKTRQQKVKSSGKVYEGKQTQAPGAVEPHTLPVLSD